MRKIVKYQHVFDTQGIHPGHIYAGFDYGGNICLATKRDDAEDRYKTHDLYKMVICTSKIIKDNVCRFTVGESYRYHDSPSVRLYESEARDRSSLQGTLATFSEQHNAFIFEFDTFIEFCQFVVDKYKKYSW